MAKLNLNAHFKEFFEFLNSEKVEYLLVGGYALAYHGHPRFTQDIDIWVNPTKENAPRLVRALRKFGFSAGTLAKESFDQPNQVFRVGAPPVQIDVMTSVAGPSFVDCFSERESAVSDGVPVNVISLKRLRENKQAAGRGKDLGDLEALPPA
jgi:phage replication-related protein YjqB (UPF0714/DUF867 family)